MGIDTRMEALKHSYAIVCADSENALAKKFESFLHKELKSYAEGSSIKRMQDQDQIRNYDFIVFVEGKKISLIDRDNCRLQIDFDENQVDYFRKGPKGKGELLFKALGLKNKGAKVLDLSAGLGMDSVFLASQGYQVTGVERNPILFFLLEHALENSQRADLKNLKFVYGSAQEYIKNAKISDFDAIYFDPMYPHKKKSALPRQEMRLFRNLVGEDEDAQEVLMSLLKKKPSRVIVKRPLQSEVLLSPVKHSFKGKSVRYDLY